MLFSASNGLIFITGTGKGSGHKFFKASRARAINPSIVVTNASTGEGSGGGIFPPPLSLGPFGFLFSGINGGISSKGFLSRPPKSGNISLKLGILTSGIGGILISVIPPKASSASSNFSGT